jgi:peroxiredoxin
LKRNPVILIIVAMVVSVMLVLGINLTRRGHTSNVFNGQGKAAPDFSLTTLDGKTVRLSDFRGKAVLLNFWATWCEPCKIEMPWFVDLQRQYAAQGLQIVGVAMDDADPEDIAKFAKKMGIDYPILVGKDSDRDAVASSYGGVQFLPETFYIDREGKVVDKAFGLKGRSEIEDNIKKALAEEPAAEVPAKQAESNSTPASKMN